jgi:hypothetical protein
VPDNWDFESGLSGWTATGSAFLHQPTEGDNVVAKRIATLAKQIESKIGGDYWWNVTFPIGHHGSHWIGTAENHPDRTSVPGTVEGDEVTGSLVSKRFQIGAPFISFLIGGEADAAKLRVELLVESAPGGAGAFLWGARWYTVAETETGHGEESLRRAVWNVQPYGGKTARIRILDYSTEGHISVDDFRFPSENPLTSSVWVGGKKIPAGFQRDGRFYDWDAPVWGMADLHTHPTSYLGFGGKMMHGELDGPIENALDDCNCDHGGWDLFSNQCGDYYRQLVMAVWTTRATTRIGRATTPIP